MCECFSVYVCDCVCVYCVTVCVSVCVCVRDCVLCELRDVGEPGGWWVVGGVAERKLPLVFSSLGRPDGKSFFIRLEAALHICRPRCLMNTGAGRAVASLILHPRGEPGRPGCAVPLPPTTSRRSAGAERGAAAASSGPEAGSWHLAGTGLPHFVG